MAASDYTDVFARFSDKVAAELLANYIADSGQQFNLAIGVPLRERTALAMVAVASVLAACETTNFAKSSTPATIQQEWAPESKNPVFRPNWDATYVYAIGSIEIGYGDLGDRKGKTLTVDPGPTKLKVFYYGHRSGMSLVFRQTDIVPLEADLKPGAHYLLRYDGKEDKAQLQLVDLATNQPVASTGDVPVVVRASPNPQPLVIPIFIPRH